MSLLRKIPWKDYGRMKYGKLGGGEESEDEAKLIEFDYESQNQLDNDDETTTTISDIKSIPVETVASSSKFIQRPALLEFNSDSSSASNSDDDENIDAAELNSCISVIPDLIESSSDITKITKKTESSNRDVYLCSKHRRFKKVINNYMILKRNVQTVREKRRQHEQEVAKHSNYNNNNNNKNINEKKQSPPKNGGEQGSSLKLKQSNGLLNLVLYKMGCVEIN